MEHKPSVNPSIPHLRVRFVDFTLGHTRRFYLPIGGALGVNGQIYVVFVECHYCVKVFYPLIEIFFLFNPIRSDKHGFFNDLLHKEAVWPSG